MAYSSPLKRQIQTTLILFSMAFCGLSQAATVSFSPNNYDFGAAQSGHLRPFMEEARAKPTSRIVISDGSGKAKKGTLSFVVEKNRSLVIYRALADEGIDPARIDIVPKAAAHGAGYVDVSLQGSTGSTTKPLRPDIKSGKSGSEVYIFAFAPGEGTPQKLREQEFQGFLLGFGRPGHDRANIAAQGDETKDPIYNKALSLWRSLSVFEIATRAGFPAAKLVFVGAGGRERRASLTWDTGTAGSAATANVKPVPVVPVMSGAKEAAAPKSADASRLLEKPRSSAMGEGAKVEARAATPKDENASNKPAAFPVRQERERAYMFDLTPFAGSLFPSGGLSKKVKTGVFYGLAIGREFMVTEQGLNRVSLSVARTKLDAKEQALRGPIHLDSIGLQIDHAFGQGRVQPWVGVGLGDYLWDGRNEDASPDQDDTLHKRDGGGTIGLGIDIKTWSFLKISPEIHWIRIGGNFSETLWTADVAFRWRH